MVKFQDIKYKLEKFAPVPAAESWDNPGLLMGRGEREIQRVYVALDATPQVVEQAIEKECDLILTHHPVIFRGIKSLTDKNGQGKKFLRLLQNDISVYSMHTNFDSCPGGMGAIVCDRMGLKNLGPMELGNYQEENSYLRAHSGEKDLSENYGIGFIAELPEEMSCRDFAAYVKRCFDLPFVTFYDGGKKIRRIACCPGSGRGEFEAVVSNRVDAFLSGDMGHHEGLDYTEEGISLVDAGHYGLEHIFVPYMAKVLREEFPELEVLEAEIDFPAQIV